MAFAIVALICFNFFLFQFIVIIQTIVHFFLLVNRFIKIKGNWNLANASHKIRQIAVCTEAHGKHAYRQQSDRLSFQFHFHFHHVCVCVCCELYILCGMQSFALGYVALALRFTQSSPPHSLWRAIFPLALYSCWFLTRRRTYVQNIFCIYRRIEYSLAYNTPIFIHIHILSISSRYKNVESFFFRCFFFLP